MKILRPLSVTLTALSLTAAVACGASEPTAPKDPMGGAINTGGTPDPSKTDTKGKPDTSKTDTAGKPDPSKTNTSKEPAGGAINTGGAPDLSKSNIPGLGSKDGGK